MDTTTPPKKRKRRSDSTHAVYCLENTVTGEQYIGITVASGNVNRAKFVLFTYITDRETA